MGNSVDIRSKHPEKHLVTLVKNEYFLRGRGPCFFASCLRGLQISAQASAEFF